jgi:4-nitrophenyl phosphatase
LSSRNVFLQNKKLFLIDLDGVVCVGKENPNLISGKRLLSKVKSIGKKVLVLTNNSTSTRETIFHNLQSLSLNIQPDEIFTACVATASYLSRNFGKAKCFLIGEKGFAEEIRREGHEIVEEDRPDFVVVGVDRMLSYAKLDTAAKHLRGSAQLIGAHKSKVYMDTCGPRLSVGPILAALEYVSGKKAVTIGKPEKPMFEEAMRRAAVSPRETVMIGDQIETDIVGASRMGISSILVTTGIDNEASMKQSRVMPDLICANADEVADLV